MRDQDCARLRQLLAEGLARRYALRARAEGLEFIVEGVEEPARLPTFQSEVGTGIPPASRPVPAPEAAVAIRVVVERLQLELKAIERAGLAAYFLLVADCARHARSIGAICVAIGSGPGSLVTYLLEISTVDPIRHGLLFERFWHPELTKPPGIYLELAEDCLGDVIEYTRIKCGSTPVAHMVTDLERDTASSLPTLGLVGSKALTILQRTRERVTRAKGREVLVDRLPPNDAKTYDLLKNGDTSGICQLESDGMRELSREFQPTSIEHIAALIAVQNMAAYRPDPAEFVRAFIARRHGRLGIRPMHQIVEPLLRETFGVLLYQEQFMRVAEAVAGFTLGRADLLRRALGKSKVEELARHRQFFISGANKRNGLNVTMANQICDWLVESSGYCCNKSHATAHATLAYQTACLKAHHPAEFLGATIETNVTRRVQHGHESGGVG
jgi:DNA polymerase III alpha subunit